MTTPPNTSAPVVLAATPLTGHTRPVLDLARHLVAAGREVTVVGGSRFAAAATATGSGFVPLSGPADFDDRRLHELQPWLHETEPGPAFLEAMFGWFTDMAPAQNAVLQDVLSRRPGAVVLHETAFYGAWPQLLGAPGIRPRTIGLGVFPLTLSGAELTMMGPPPPQAGLDTRAAATAFNTALADQLAATTARTQRIMGSLGATATLPTISDAQVLLPDVYAQLTVPSFEYPRGDAPSSLRLVGALPPEPSGPWNPPAWWPELSEHRVVALTQGTVANHDLTDLIQPALDGLAGEDVLVVVGLGGRELAPSDLRVPANARVETFVPFDKLFPHTDVVVTNGGYGGVQLALHHGVPLVVAGASEDKPAVAARVAEFGVGLDLHTGRPDPTTVCDAVHRVLAEPGFAQQARALAAEYRAADPVGAISDIIDAA